MLFILTGDVQTGKTRWLESLIDSLDANGIDAQGVLAPGVWRSGDDPAAIDEFVDANGYEKLGIDNVLLPDGKRIPFARRRDIAEALGLLDPNAQSEQANLLWHIDERSIDIVNEHIASLPHPTASSQSLLIIDELGRLELLRNGGLVEALNLLEQGPSDTFPHALAIVRADLLHEATTRFTCWGEPVLIYPNDESTHRVLSSFDGFAS